MVTEKRPKRVRRRRKPKPSGRKIVKAKHGESLHIDGPSVINVHMVYGRGRIAYLEIVPKDKNGPQDDRKECV
jgi:hypothetical protein